MAFFGIRSDRDTVLHGTIKFFCATHVGVLIALISCARRENREGWHPVSTAT